MKLVQSLVLGALLLFLASSDAAAAPALWGGSGDDIDQAPSVVVCAHAGGEVTGCGHAVGVPGGWYTAKHVAILGTPILPDGIVRPWSMDPSRDLAHIVGTGDPATVFGTAELYDVLTVRNSRGWSAVRVMGFPIGWGTTWTEPLIATCHIGGRLFTRGDSGSGMHRADAGAGGPHGALTAIYVGGEMDPNAPGTVEYNDPRDSWCGLGQLALLVAVP